MSTRGDGPCIQLARHTKTRYRRMRNVRIAGTITLKDNSVIQIDDKDILQGSLYFTEQCVSGEDIEIGNVYASEMGLTLTSPPETRTA